MRNPPPDVVASWPQPNHVNPVTRGPALLIVEMTILALALICVALRLYVRYVIVKRTWWDDWLMVMAAVFTTGVTVCVILADRIYGWNIHVWDLTEHQATRGRMISIVAQSLFIFASGLSKLSILISYLRIAPAESFFRRATHASIWIVNLCMVGFIVAVWCQCRPIDHYWNLKSRHEGCIAEGPPIMGQAFTTVATDILVYILPMPVLYSLQLPRMQRIGLMLLFGLGSVSCIGGIMRAYWSHQVVYQTYDVTWVGFTLWIWTAVEVNTAVICGCVPSLRPLLFPSGAFNLGGSGSSSARHWSRKFDEELDDLQGLKGAPSTLPLRMPPRPQRDPTEPPKLGILPDPSGDTFSANGVNHLGIGLDAPARSPRTRGSEDGLVAVAK